MTTKYQYVGGIMTPESRQRMKDDRIVNRYMAEIDTRLDLMALAQRDLDNSRTFSYESPSAFQTIMMRDTDLQKLIENIRAADAFETIDTERDFAKYQAHTKYSTEPDPYLAYVLHTAGNDYADEHGGHVEWRWYVHRFDRCLIMEDDRGFITLCICKDEDRAKEFYRNEMNEYAVWDTEENDLDF